MWLSDECIVHIYEFVCVYTCVCQNMRWNYGCLLYILYMNLYVQSNFNGSNTFGTMKISPRLGQFEPMRGDNSARSGGIIRFALIFYNTEVCCASH